jgi:hypothetical protein
MPTATIRNLIQEAIIHLFRPLVVREVRGWGKIYGAFVGSYTRDWL